MHPKGSESWTSLLRSRALFRFSHSVLQGLGNSSAYRHTKLTYFGAETHIFEELLQVIVLVALDQYVFVVNVFDDDVVMLLGVDLHDDGFDGGIAFD